ncbi:MAG: vWA domain-containing protein [Cyanobacteria bacterium J06636_16]
MTDVTVVLDRSGSMASCRVEAENGVNHFVEQQRKQEGECIFSLVQFDTEYEFVHKGTPISEVGKFELHPRGMTALLDAVGRAINETGERLANMVESDRPRLVVLVIVTDGQENSSHEFSRTQIKTMIEHQQTQYQWQFTFLGANQDAFAEAASIGIARGATANYAAAAPQAAFAGASASLKRMRRAAMQGDKVECDYTEDERRSMSS